MELNGNIFQVHTEQRKRGQFQTTLDALQVFTSTKFKNEIEHLNRLFIDLTKPIASKPYAPLPTTITYPKDASKTIQVIDEIVKMYVQEIF